MQGGKNAEAGSLLVVAKRAADSFVLETALAESSIILDHPANACVSEAIRTRPPRDLMSDVRKPRQPEQQ